MTILARRLITLELLWLALLSPFLFFPEEGRGIAMAGVPLLWGLRWVAWRRVVPRTPLDLPLLVLLVMAGVSLLVSPDPAFSLPKVTGLVLGVALYFALAERAALGRGLVIGIAAPLGVTAAMAAVGLFTTSWTAKFPALSGLTERLPRRILELPNSPPDGFNPNGLAGALLLTAPLALVLILLPRNPLLQALPRPLRVVAYPLMAAACLLIIAVLALTQSRGGLVGGAVGVAALLIIPLVARGGARALVVLAAGGAAALAVIAWQLPVLPARLLGSETLQGRLDLWQRAYFGIQDFPFTGMGMGMFRRVLPMLYPLSGIALPTDVGHAHNQFLSAGVDLGVPGLVGLAALWLGASMMLWEALRAPGAPAAWRWVLIGLGAGLAAHFVWALTDSNVLGAKAHFPFWAVLGGLAIYHERLVVRSPYNGRGVRSVIP